MTMDELQPGQSAYITAVGGLYHGGRRRRCLAASSSGYGTDAGNGSHSAEDCTDG